MDRIINPVPLHPRVIASILVKNPIRMINAYVLKMEHHD